MPLWPAQNVDHAPQERVARAGSPGDPAHEVPTGRVVAVTTYTAHAVRWDEGWELHVDGVGVTQVSTLDRAVQQVRDFVETDLEIDASDAEVVIVHELGDLGQRVREARERAREAEEARRLAARQTREAVRALRAEGISVTDTAAILGVSRGRVSELLKAG